MTVTEAARFVLLRSLGNFLVLLAIYGVFATFGPAFYYELQYRIIQVRGITFKVARVPQVPRAEDTSSKPPQTNTGKNSQPGFVDVLTGEKDQQLTPNDILFSILIPKIGASATIFRNVDPASADEYLPVLQKGIAHAKGTVFPGMQGTTYLFAHSTDNWWNVGRYNAVFYLLKDLEQGDEIVIFFEGERYDYVVSDKFIADPTDTSLLVNAQKTEEQLVLQTCWPPGTTWKRIFVIAKPKY